MLEEKKLFIKKFLFRSKYMGCKENNMLFASFAENHLENLSEIDLILYHELIKTDDETLLGWICGKLKIPEKFTKIITKIRNFKITS